MPQSDTHRQSFANALPNRADLLDYITDMIQELRELSEQTDCTTLTSILDVARLEAAQQGAAAHRDTRSQVG